MAFSGFSFDLESLLSFYVILKDDARHLQPPCRLLLEFGPMAGVPKNAVDSSRVFPPLLFPSSGPYLFKRTLQLPRPLPPTPDPYVFTKCRNSLLNPHLWLFALPPPFEAFEIKPAACAGPISLPWWNHRFPVFLVFLFPVSFLPPLLTPSNVSIVIVLLSGSSGPSSFSWPLWIPGSTLFFFLSLFVSFFLS